MPEQPGFTSQDMEITLDRSTTIELILGRMLKGGTCGALITMGTDVMVQSGDLEPFETSVCAVAFGALYALARRFGRQ